MKANYYSRFILYSMLYEPELPEGSSFQNVGLGGSRNSNGSSPVIPYYLIITSKV